jgi:hypothetical protein
MNIFRPIDRRDFVRLSAGASLVATAFRGTKARAAASAPHVALPNHSVIVTHASRHYQTHPETIAATTELLAARKRAGQAIYELGQNDVATDPDWYALRPTDVTRVFLSDYGEHPLYPATRTGEVFQVTAVGGYHCACLGWTLAEVCQRFLAQRAATTLVIELPMAAIYTGFLRDGTGALVPGNAEDESKADDSIDGLNLAQVTQGLSDEDFVPVMRDNLRWGPFAKAPLAASDHTGLGFELACKGLVLQKFSWSNEVLPARVTRRIRFDYV